MTGTRRVSRKRTTGIIASIGLGGTAFCVLTLLCPTRVAAQPAPGIPNPWHDPRDDWMKESDWIWRSSRKHQYPHHSMHPNTHWPVPFYGSGSWGHNPYPYPMPYGVNAPYRPSLYDPAYPTGQPMAPPAAGLPVEDPMAKPTSLAPLPEDGRVDPGSRRYVSRWQKSGRGYIHVYGWEWTSNGVLKQKLDNEFVDRSELADPMMLDLEAVPARGGPADPEGNQRNTARAESGDPANSLFDSLDTNGDGQISTEEFRAGLTKPGAD